MGSIFEKLTRQQEEAADPFQTKRLINYPKAIDRLATVVVAIEEHFLSDQWETEVIPGSVRLRHKTQGRWLVRVFIDDGNRLANKNNLQLSEEPIVVGVDLTDRTPYERHLIREDLRIRFPYYVDPEAGGKKIWVQVDEEHRLDYLFIPAGPCDLPIDQRRVATIIGMIEQEGSSPSAVID